MLQYIKKKEKEKEEEEEEEEEEDIFLYINNYLAYTEFTHI